MLLFSRLLFTASYVKSSPSSSVTGGDSKVIYPLSVFLLSAPALVVDFSNTNDPPLRLLILETVAQRPSPAEWTPPIPILVRVTWVFW